ncbi:MAG: nucleoside hydrolase, partial [Bacteroidota bacterium]
MKFLRFAILLCLFACESPEKSSLALAESEKVKEVWVDADLAIGVQNPDGLYGDVDDGFALIHLLQSEKIEIAGISTVFGNT